MSWFSSHSCPQTFLTLELFELLCILVRLLEGTLRGTQSSNRGQVRANHSERQTLPWWVIGAGQALPHIVVEFETDMIDEGKHKSGRSSGAGGKVLGKLYPVKGRRRFRPPGLLPPKGALRRSVRDPRRFLRGCGMWGPTSNPKLTEWSGHCPLKQNSVHVPGLLPPASRRGSQGGPATLH